MFGNVHIDYIVTYWDGVNWVDITPDTIIANIEAIWGMTDGNPATLMAEAGQLTFTLNNALNKYVPEIGTPAVGWGKGAPVRIIFTYDGQDYVGYHGRVDTITIHNEPVDVKSVEVSCLDWFDFAAKYPLEFMQVIVDQTADAALTSIVAAMPVKPAVQAIDKGDFVFPSLNDAISTTTHASEEFAKLALSEYGYCYIRHDRAYGETLVFENNSHRKGTNPLSKVPKMKADAGFLLVDDGGAGDRILFDGGAGSKLIPDLTNDAIVNNLATAIDETYADNIINRVTINAYPKTVDTTRVRLHKLGNKPLKINSGATKSTKGLYTNPNGGAEISGIGLLAPTATTDYLFNTQADGLGLDITAFLTVVVTYDSTRPHYALTNTYTQAGYVTKLDAWGFGIYQDDALTVTVESAASELKYGYQELSLDQTYQQDTDLGERAGAQILEASRLPHVRVNSISFDANYSTLTMQMFLNLDVGSLLQVIDTYYSVNDWFYIQGVNYTVSPVGQIKVTYIVKKASSIASGGLSPVGMTFHGTGSGDVIDFGPFSTLPDMRDLTISFWMKPTSIDVGDYGHILATLDGLSGFRINFSHDVPHYQLTFYNFCFASSGNLTNTDNVMAPSGSDIHIVITGNLLSFAKPIIYKDGDVIATSDTPPTGNFTQPGATDFVIGALRASNGTFNHSFDGRLNDFRVYNRILTPDEVTTLYNGGTPDASLVTDGLVFQGPCVHTSELAHYTGLTLTTDDKVIDNVGGIIGTPHGSPKAVAF